MTNTKGYTASEVKEMAESKGLECRIVKSGGLEIVQPISTLEKLGLVREWSRYLSKEQTAAQMAEDVFRRIEKSNAALDRIERM